MSLDKKNVQIKGATFDPTTDSLEAIRDTVDGVPTTTEAEGYVENAIDTDGSHDITTENDKTETEMFEIAKAGIYALSIWLDMDELDAASEGGTVSFQLYNKVDGSAYTGLPSVLVEYVVGTSREHPTIEVAMVHGYCKLTIQCSTDVSDTRAIPYRYIVRDLGG